MIDLPRVENPPTTLSTYIYNSSFVIIIERGVFIINL